jgi:hypothetical protein
MGDHPWWSRLGKLAGVIGFLSAALALYQWFAIGHLAEVEGRYECGGGYDTNVFEFIKALDTHAGEVVMLRFQMCAQGFARKVTGESVERRFESETFVEAAGIDPGSFEWRQEGWDRVTPLIEEKLSLGTVTMREVSWDNGIGLAIVGQNQTTNPYSAVSLGSEGVDSAYGPFQISKQRRNEGFTFVLSPAPATDRLRTQVRCAREELPLWLRSVYCPFL